MDDSSSNGGGDGGTVAAAIYCRISSDATGAGEGVERQERECRSLAAARGWAVAEVFVDNDVSATSGVQRPAYERMVDAVQRGGVSAVVAWKIDRLTRRPREIEDWIDLADATGVGVVTVDGRLDLTTPVGQFHARTLANVASLETSTAAQRRRAANLARALRGEPARTGTRRFGWADDRIALHEHEAPLLRDAVDCALGRTGESLSALIRRWRDEGVRTVGGGLWTTTKLGWLLTSPTLAGIVVHQGDVLLHPDSGEPVVGQWEPLISLDEHRALVATFDARRRGPGRPPTSLLSGIAVCGRCGHVLRAARDRGKPRYECSASGGTYPDACGSVGILRDPLDEFVVDALLATLSTPAVESALAARADAVAAAQRDRSAEPPPAERIATLRASLSDLDHARFVEQSIDASRHRAMVAAIEQRIEQAQRALAAAAHVPALGSLAGAGADVSAAWERADTDRRRDVLRAVFERVSVAPVAPGKRTRHARGECDVAGRVSLALSDALSA